jgi:hypothetical protein
VREILLPRRNRILNKIQRFIDQRQHRLFGAFGVALDLENLFASFIQGYS